MRSIWRFIRADVAGVLPDIILYFHFWLCVFCGAFFIILNFYFRDFNVVVPFGLLFDKGSDYNSTIFGFSLGVVAVTIAIPREEFLRHLVRIYPNKPQSPMDAIVFLVSYTALLHFCSFIMLTVMAFQTAPLGQGETPHYKDGLLASKDFPPYLTFFYGLYIMVQIYSMFQFVIVLISIWRLAQRYSQEVRAALSKNSR